MSDTKPSAQTAKIAKELRDIGDGFRWLTSSEREQIARWALRFRAQGKREAVERAAQFFAFGKEHWSANEVMRELRRLAAEVTDADG